MLLFIICWTFLESVMQSIKLVSYMDVDHFYNVFNDHRRFMARMSFYVHVLPLICRYHGKSGEILTTAYMVTVKAGVALSQGRQQFAIYNLIFFKT